MIKVGVGRELTQDENDSLNLLWEGQKGKLNPFITIEAFNLLRRFTGQIEVGLFLEMVDVMQAGRYFKRWARRLREYGFTREDAKVLGLGTFGTDDTGSILGADAIVTFDQHFIRNYYVYLDALQERLSTMTINLSIPYSEALLPILVQPIQVLSERL
jgi:hypothetical protein